MDNRIAEKTHLFSREGKRPALFSLGLNLFFAALKFILYRSTGSSAILAETVHSLTDVMGSLLVVGGIYFSGMKSERFPWGLYKIENIAAVLSAGLIFISAYEIAQMIYSPPPEGLRNLGITFIFLFIMVVPVVLFARYEGKLAKELNSPSLAADAQNWKMDIAPLTVVAVGIAGAKLSYPIADRIAAAVVLILVVRAGYGILKDSLKSLLDASVDRATLDMIKNVIRGVPQVTEIVSLYARNSGRFIFVSTDLRLSLKRLKEAHEVADDIEREIRRRIPFIERVVIHYEPEKRNYQRFAVPLANKAGEISEHFAKAPFIALWDKRISDGAVASQEILGNPFSQLEKGKGIKLAEFLVTMKVDVLYTKELFEGKGPEYVFSDAGVEIRKTNAQNLKNLMEHDPGEMHFMEVLS